MLRQKPRRSGEITKPNKGNSSTLRRGPKKTYNAPSNNTNSKEIDELRERLIENPDFTGIEMPKLLLLQENTYKHIQFCIQNQFYNQAKIEQDFDDKLRKEISRQSNELERYMQQQTSRSKASETKFTPKAYVFLMKKRKKRFLIHYFGRCFSSYFQQNIKTKCQK